MLVKPLWHPLSNGCYAGLTKPSGGNFTYDMFLQLGLGNSTYLIRLTVFVQPIFCGFVGGRPPRCRRSPSASLPHGLLNDHPDDQIAVGKFYFIGPEAFPVRRKGSDQGR